MLSLMSPDGKQLCSCSWLSHLAGWMPLQYYRLLVDEGTAPRSNYANLMTTNFLFWRLYYSIASLPTPLVTLEEVDDRNFGSDYKN
ncbi:hypothetical protein ILYODFUR_018669 [Ilyodon furcidens]|uniref:Uncharacterized protein n=1 Tax=Ilyodon furcidens TaxID=33524 RepID=A0ABV0UK04_9TELE